MTHATRLPLRPGRRWLPPLLAALLLAACATPPRDTARPPAGPLSGPAACPPCPAAPACPPAPACAPPEAPPALLPAARPLAAARWSDLPGWQEDDTAAAWPAFLASCRALASRREWPHWRAVCEDAAALPRPDAAAARRFFEARLTPWRMTQPDGSAEGMITGYYEPLLRGARVRGKPYVHPVLATPPDLLTIELGDLLPELKDKRVRGRLVGNKVLPYYSRAEIGRQAEQEQRALFWVDDPVELFFLQVQGSGRIRLPSGELARVGYADQNGHPYQSIGRVLVERGELKLEHASMQGIQAWARANPARLDELLNANPSYVFFRELPAGKRGADEGPPGALGVPLTAQRSLAVDPRYIPLGAPVFLATTRPNSSTPLQRLMLAQDTGGAIKGVVRADFFWGFGAEAGAEAGRMRQSGRLWVLLPPGLAPE